MLQEKVLNMAVCLFLRVCAVCVCTEPVLHSDSVSLELQSVELWFSLMVYLPQQMYSSLLHSCIPHVFTLFDKAVIFFFCALVLLVLVVVVADSFSAYGLVPLQLYVHNTAVALWLYLVLKCLQLGNVKNVEGGGSDLAWSATAS